MNRKSKHIREVNMLLERRYFSEQATPTTGTTTGTTSPQPTTTTTTSKKISEKEVSELVDCSSITKLSPKKTEGDKVGDYTIYMVDNKPYCKDKKETKS